MWKITVILAAIVALSPATPVRADDDTVQVLYNKCTAKDPVMDMYCMGKLEGAAGVLSMIAGSVDKDVAICPLKGYTFGQLQRIYIYWAEKNPGAWTDSAVVGIWRAFREQWPCK